MSSEISEDRDNRRKEPRTELYGEVAFAWASNFDDMKEKGVVLNISTSGASIFSHYELREGTLITLRGEGIWEGMKYATVVWCKKVEEGIYQIGLSILK